MEKDNNGKKLAYNFSISLSAKVILLNFWFLRKTEEIMGI